MIRNQLSSLKICFKKTFEEKYTNNWDNEEYAICVLVQELKTGFNQRDNSRIKDAVDERKRYLLINDQLMSSRISESG